MRTNPQRYRRRSEYRACGNPGRPLATLSDDGAVVVAVLLVRCTFSGHDPRPPVVPADRDSSVGVVGNRVRFDGFPIEGAHRVRHQQEVRGSGELSNNEERGEKSYPAPRPRSPSLPKRSHPVRVHSLVSFHS